MSQQDFIPQFQANVQEAHLENCPAYQQLTTLLQSKSFVDPDWETILLQFQQFNTLGHGELYLTMLVNFFKATK